MYFAAFLRRKKNLTGSTDQGEKNLQLFMNVAAAPPDHPTPAEERDCETDVIYYKAKISLFFKS